MREYLTGEENLGTASAALDQFLSTAAGGRRPIPYYALLLADEDRMGKVIDAQQDAGDHRRLSQALAGFSGGVRAIVEKYKGSLVYADGDDVLAFVPLHTVLRAARELAETFRDSLEGFRDFEGAYPTLSVGIAVSPPHASTLRRACARPFRRETRQGVSRKERARSRGQ